MFLGVPFNIASYALLMHMLAQQCDLDVGRVRVDGRRLPPLSQSPEQADLQLRREPLPLPQLELRRRPASIFDYQYEDFEIVNYQYPSRHQGARGGLTMAQNRPEPQALEDRGSSALRRESLERARLRRLRHARHQEGRDASTSISATASRTRRPTSATRTTTRTTTTRSCSSSTRRP